MARSEVQWGEGVRKATPSLRLFRMHPDLGLEQTEGDWVAAPRVRDLSVTWLALPVAEQRARERDMLRGLLRDLAARTDAPRFEAQYDADGDDPRCWRAALTPDAIEELLARPPEALAVAKDGRTVVQATFDEDGAAVGVWWDPWRAGALQGELVDAWWEPAQERLRASQGRSEVPAPRGRVSREGRAALYRAWEGRGERIFYGVACAAALAWLIEETLTSVVLVIIVVCTVMATVSDVLRLWYERS